MPIIAGDIDFRLSGGAANTDTSASLGGAKSSVELTNAALHNLFDIVSSAEALAGDVEYRCIYVHNSHATLTMQSAVVWIQAQAASADTVVVIALAGEGVNGTAETVGNESTAPVGETFSAAANEGASLAIGDIPPGEHQAIWIMRTISAAASAYNSDSTVLRVKCDTAG